MKKALIITYYWPPAGGPGVQRWLKFVKYLPEFGVEPVVLVPENPHYPIEDKSLETEIPQGVTVIKRPINEPYKWAKLFSKNTKTLSKGILPEPKKQSFIEKLLLFVRGNFFIPDARVGWVKPTVKFLENYLAENNIDIVITTGPPHSLHLIGLKLKQSHQFKWIADFRDPWTTIDYHSELKLTPSSQKKHKALERNVLNTIDHIVVTSPTTKTQFSEMTSKPIEVITNGYDEETYDNVALDSHFSVAHIGSLLSKRNPEILWKTLSELKQEVPEFSEALKLVFVGAVSDSVLKTVEGFGLNGNVENRGYVSHNESVKFQKKSQLLLLLESDLKEKACIIPGKLFEYMASRRPIVALGPKGWDVAQILQQTKTGHCFQYTDYDALKNTLLSHFNTYKNNILQVDSTGVEQFNRKNLTKKLVGIID